MSACLGTLREYSKSKKTDSFKHSLTEAQFNAIKAFIKHYRYNQPSNIDEMQWDKTLNNWIR